MNKMKFLFKFISIFLLFPLLTQARPVYTIEDLEALETSRNYPEFLNHVWDLRPTQRDDHWISMLSLMAGEYVKALSKKTIFNEEDYKLVEKVNKWDLIQVDQFFNTYRNSYAQKYFLNCFNLKTTRKTNDTNQSCQQKIIKFWKATNERWGKNPKIAYSLSKFFEKSQRSEIWEIYKTIVSSKEGQKYCHNKDVLGAISLQLFKKSKSNLLAYKQAKALSKGCLDSIRPILVKFLTVENRQYSNRAFAILDQMNLIENNQKELYYFNYLISAPKQGKLFNQAWNHLKGLSVDYKRRDTLLRTLKKLDPLPGTIFSEANTLKGKTIINYVGDNFPEYLQTYALTCTSYLAGKIEFPNGNPTPYCHQLFKEAVKTKWLSSRLISDYKKLTNF